MTRWTRTEVVDGGFLVEGRVYESLSAAARAITGGAVNGFAFFGLVRS